MVLLDTNIISYILKEDSRAADYKEYLQQADELAIAWMTVAELFQWALIRQWSPKRIIELENWLHQTYTILPKTYEMCQLWARIRVVCRSKGQKIGTADAWIAATALHYNIPLVTHNAKDFQCITDLKLFSRA